LPQGKCSTLFLILFFITLTPRVEWFTKSMSLHTSPPRSRCTFLQIRCSQIESSIPAELARKNKCGLRIMFDQRSVRARNGERCWKFEYSSNEADERQPGKGNSNSHGARPVHAIIAMIKWIPTSRLSIENSLSLAERSVRGQNSEIPRDIHDYAVHCHTTFT